MDNSIFKAEHRSWRSMIRRCSKSTDPGFKHYGGRGIKVCERWRESFDRFLEDMGPKPSKTHSIDRINNDGDYEPGNCRWATRSEQSLNTCRTKYATYNGVTKSLREWSKEAVCGPKTFMNRVTCNWDIGQALTEPYGGRVNRRILGGDGKAFHPDKRRAELARRKAIGSRKLTEVIRRWEVCLGCRL